MINDLLLLMIAIPLVFIAVVAGVLVSIWFIGWRKRKQYEKLKKEAQAIFNAERTPPSPHPVEPLPPINEPSPPSLDRAAVEEALSKLADALNVTMATQQSQAHDIAQAKQQFLLIQAQVSTFDQDVRRIDAQLHAIRNPLPANKMYDSIEAFLTKKPKTGPPVASINPEDDPNDIDPPDAEFDEAGNMISELPTLARPEPAPPPIIPKPARNRGKKK